MKPLRLTPAGNPQLFYVFHTLVNEKVTLRNRYADLACPRCKKFDEVEALRRGIEADIRVRSKRDVFANAEWMTCVSRRFLDIAAEEGISGFESAPIGQTGFSVLFPGVEAPVDVKLTSMRFIGVPCEHCGRYRETVRWPEFRAVTLPSDPKVICFPKVDFESPQGRMLIAIAGAGAVEALQRRNVTGVDWDAGGD